MLRILRAGILASVLWLGTFPACSMSRVKMYRDIVDPMVGSSKKDDVNRVLGSPESCSHEKGLEMCEYRTSAARNEVIPDMSSRNPAMGPDLSPYDRFDVLHLYFDDFGILKDWDPIVVKP